MKAVCINDIQQNSPFNQLVIAKSFDQYHFQNKLPKSKPSKNTFFSARQMKMKPTSKIQVQLSSLISGINVTNTLLSAKTHNSTFLKMTKRTNNSTISNSQDEITNSPLNQIRLRKRPSRFMNVQLLHSMKTSSKTKRSSQSSKCVAFKRFSVSTQKMTQSNPIPKPDILNKNSARSLIKHIISSPFKLKLNEDNPQIYQSIPTMQDSAKDESELRIKLTPSQQIDDFNSKQFGTRTMQQIIKSQRNMPQKLRARNSKERYKKIRLSLLNTLHHLHKLKLTLNEFLINKIFPTKPYENDQAKYFFQLCKCGRNDRIRILLELNKYLVYEYDHLVMTALHWCALRGLKRTTLILLNYGADPDAQDIVGRTPLYLAFQHKQNDIAQLLILHRADPWNKPNLDYFDALEENPIGKQILSSTRKTHILLRMTPPSLRKYIWEKEQLELYIEPNSKQQ